MFALRVARSNAKSTAFVGALASAGLGCCIISQCQASPSADGIVSRLGRYVTGIEKSEHIFRRTEMEGVTIYGITDSNSHRNAGGLPIVRVAQTVIKAPVEKVAKLWWNVNERKNWDSVNTQDCQLVRVLNPDQHLVYLQGKPKRGGVISSRDFSYVMHRLPASEVTAAKGSILFVQSNMPSDVPTVKSSVRGDVNSLLLLEPIDAKTTKASYAIEMDVKGWLPTKVVDAAADETPLTLAVMRDYLERN